MGRDQQDVGLLMDDGSGGISRMRDSLGMLDGERSAECGIFLWMLDGERSAECGIVYGCWTGKASAGCGIVYGCWMASVGMMLDCVWMLDGECWDDGGLLMDAGWGVLG